jgi:hypothetical protein
MRLSFLNRSEQPSIYALSTLFLLLRLASSPPTQSVLLGIFQKRSPTGTMFAILFTIPVVVQLLFTGELAHLHLFLAAIVVLVLEGIWRLRNQSS